MKVLLATDGSPNARAALRSGSRILSGAGREMRIACVVPRDSGAPEAHQDRMLRRGTHVLNVAKEALRQDGVYAGTSLLVGSAARALLHASRDFDVTVIGAESHKNGWQGLGPVASRLLEHANTTILIARPAGEEGVLRILIPVDGSEASLRAVEQLNMFIDLRSADVTVVHVVETPWLAGGPEEEPHEYARRAEEQIDPQAQAEREMERSSEEILDAAREKLGPCGAITTLVYRGLPADEILTEATTGDYDLIVMAASGSDDLKHQMLGSVSYRVAWNAPCSVLVVRSPD